MGEIVETGFDFRLAEPGHYGRGTYFASQACKAHQYTSPQKRGVRHMLMARVALGQPYFTGHVLRDDARRPPKNGTSTCDSVVANPGPMRGHQNGHQDHQEF